MSRDDIEPLNPTLYRQLKRVFGHVRISNQGEAMMARYGVNILTQREELIMDYSGEQYVVCCDRCNDTKFRLYISHRWGVLDSHGKRNLGLLYCQNEDCYSAYEARLDLLGALSGTGSRLAQARVSPGAEISGPRIVAFPGPVLTLDTLPPDHVANRYLAGRFFDPERLGRYYKVGYCPESDFYLARNRIIIPVYQDGELKGWQARYIGEMDWKAEGAPPKYWSCPGMNRSQVIYNQDNARTYRTGVGMEGPLDVWALGPMGMGTLGFPMTGNQMRTVVALFADYSFVMLFDPDVLTNPKTKASYDRIYEAMDGKFRHGLAAVQLPDGYDPANFDRGYLRDFVAREAKAQGVKVSWRQR